MTIVHNMYKTLEATNKPVMFTLNPYSSQLVDNLNRMMMTESGAVASMNPQLERLTAKLRKKNYELGHPGPCKQTSLLRDQANLHSRWEEQSESWRCCVPNSVSTQACVLEDQYKEGPNWKHVCS